MSEAIVGLLSAVFVVVIKGIIDYAMDRRKRKDTLEDGKSEETKEILDAIDGVRKEVAEVREEVKKTKQDVKDMADSQEKSVIVECRVRILRFADEIVHGTPRHSKDHFDQTFDDITNYEAYCRSHPNFKNDITTTSVELIKETYKERLKKNDFL